MTVAIDSSKLYQILRALWGTQGRSFGSPASTHGTRKHKVSYPIAYQAYRCRAQVPDAGAMDRQSRAQKLTLNRTDDRLDCVTWRMAGLKKGEEIELQLCALIMLLLLRAIRTSSPN